MEIRRATAKDADEIAAIIKKHYREDYMGYVTFSGSYIKEKMKKDNFFFVAENGLNNTKKIVGCIRASIVDMDLADIRSLCVYEEYRGKGVAKQLLQAALDLLREKKMRKICARAKSDNASAISVFKSAGFEQEGCFKEHYRKGIDIVQMFKFI